ncbi:hypothetical protein HanPI659440_Chr13g0514381 [Helianthus annuus]|nr:hypothetical protein HanPI659440_Chr13g0514381 [Helianthus annuus]
MAAHILWFNQIVMQILSSNHDNPAATRGGLYPSSHLFFIEHLLISSGLLSLLFILVCVE